MTKSLMKCNYNPFDDDEPDLRFPFEPSSPIPEQVANLIFRFGEFRKLHKQILSSLNMVSDAHYKVLSAENLMSLQQPIQVLLFAREALLKIDEAFEKDIAFCNEYLLKLEQEMKDGLQENIGSSEEGS